MTAATNKRFKAKNGLDANSLTLINLANPVNNTDAANKLWSLATFGALATGNTWAADQTFSTAIVLPISSTSGGIVMDSGGHKRISWNDGDGNFNIRAGHWFNGSRLYLNDGAASGGAAAMTMNCDNTDGAVGFYVAPIGAAGATVSWANTLILGVTGLSTALGFSASILSSAVATGTAPITVSSVTKCVNLNADMVDDKHIGTSGNTIPLLDGSNTWASSQIFQNGFNYFGNVAGTSFLGVGTGTANTPFIDFHSSTSIAGYNARISCLGGSTTTNSGALKLEASSVTLSGVSGGTRFTDASGATVAVLGTDGDLWKGSADNIGYKYWNQGDFLLGTSGHAVPFLDGGNIWSENQVFSHSLLNIGGPTSNSSLEFWTGAANYPLIDFHSSTAYADYNARISCSNGTSATGSGVLSLQASALNIYGNSFLAMNPAGTSYFIYADASAVQLFNKTTIGAGSNNIFDGVAAARPLLVNSSDINTTLGSSSNAIAICNTATTSGNVSQLNFSAITGVSTNQYSSGWIAVKHGARVNGEYPAGEMAFAISKSVAGTSNFAPTIRLHLTNSGTLFKDSAGATVAVLGEDGDMWKGSADNTGSKYWHAGNMGSASGLDADTVDGQHGAYYSDLANATGTLSSSRLADSGVVSGTYNSSSTIIRPFTIDAKGRITSVGANVTIAPAFSDVINKPTTLAGYGITDAQALDADLTAIVALTGANGIVKKTAGVWALDTTTYGTITSVTATYPVASSGGTAPVISMPAATALNPGYLTASDWLTFNNKSNTAGTVTSVSLDVQVFKFFAA